MTEGSEVVAAAEAYFGRLETGEGETDLAASYLRRSGQVREVLPSRDVRRSAIAWEHVRVARLSEREAVVDMSLRHDIEIEVQGRLYEASHHYVTPSLLWLTEAGWKMVAYTRAGRTRRLRRPARRSSLDADFVRPTKAGIPRGDVEIEPLHVTLQWDSTRVVVRVTNEASEPVHLKTASVNLPHQLRWRPLGLFEQALLQPGETTVLDASTRAAYSDLPTHLEVVIGRWTPGGKQLTSGAVLIELGPSGREVLRADGWTGPMDL